MNSLTYGELPSKIITKQEYNEILRNSAIQTGAYDQRPILPEGCVGFMRGHYLFLEKDNESN